MLPIWNRTVGSFSGEIIISPLPSMENIRMLFFLPIEKIHKGDYDGSILFHLSEKTTYRLSRKWFMDDDKLKFIKKMEENARWWIRRGSGKPQWVTWLCEVAFNNDHLKVLKHLNIHCSLTWNELFCLYIHLYPSQLENFEMFLENDSCHLDGYACEGAARDGDLEMFKWLTEQECDTFISYNVAAFHGHLPILEYYISIGKNPFTTSTLLCAVRGEHLNIIKYVDEKCGRKQSHNYVEQRFACALAAERGNMEILKYLHDHDFLWDEWSCAYASKNGHLEVLQYLRENGCPWNRYSAIYAAERGHREVLKWLKENDCPWDLSSNVLWKMK